MVHCPELDALTSHVRSFAQMLTERQGERLPQWLDAVRRDNLPSLHTLAAGIERDRDAVIAGLTLPWNSGGRWAPVEWGPASVRRAAVSHEIQWSLSGRKWLGPTQCFADTARHSARRKVRIAGRSSPRVVEWWRLSRWLVMGRFPTYTSG